MLNIKRPLIGIAGLTLCSKDWTERSPGAWMDCLFWDYTRSVLAAGGISLVIPPIQYRINI
jgi:hypothetical protein